MRYALHPPSRRRRRVASRPAQPFEAFSTAAPDRDTDREALVSILRNCCELLAGTPISVIRHVEFSRVLPVGAEEMHARWRAEARTIAASYNVDCVVELRDHRILVWLERASSVPRADNAG